MAGRVAIAVGLLVAVCARSAASTSATLCGAGSAAATATALTACGVTDLATMSIGDAFNPGTPSFCVAACQQALADVVIQNQACGDVDAPTQRLHEQLQRQQYECNPPTPQCQTALFDYLFFTVGSEGEACARQAKAALAAGTQAAYSSYCTSSCTQSIQERLDAFREAGCASWPAFIDTKQRHETICLKVGNTFCDPDVRGLAGTVASALNKTLSVAARTTAATSACTPCFIAAQRLLDRDRLALRRPNADSEICVRDTGLFCLPVVDQSEADALTAAGGTRNDVFVNRLSQLSCATGLKRCANKIWAYRRHWSISAAEIGQLQALLEFSCLSNLNLQTCGPLMSSISDGLFTTDEPGQTCEPTDLAGECREPSFCQTFANPDVCASQCSQAVGTQVTNLGCCFNSHREMHRRLSIGLAGTNELFARLLFLGSKCCRVEVTECPNTFIDPCSQFLQKLSVVLVHDFPFQFAFDNLEAYNTSLTSDLGKSIGVLAEGIELLSIESEADGAQTVASFQIGAQHSGITSLIEADFAALVANNDLVLAQSAALHDTRCTPGVNLDCNSAGTLVASLATALACILAVLLV